MTTRVAAAPAAETGQRWPVVYLLRVASMVAVVLSWLGLLLAVTLVAEPTREVVIWAPGHANLMRVIDRAPVSLVEIPGRSVVVRGEEPGYVARLYGSGAWLVLPARRGVCGNRTGPVRRVAREA